MATHWFEYYVSLVDLPTVFNPMGETIRRYFDRYKNTVLTIGFSGEMGAGKTTLIKGLVNALGSMTRVTSPTYDLVHRHEVGFGSIIHADLYRLDSQEIIDLDLDYYSGDSGCLRLIEWPEKLADIRLDACVSLDNDWNGGRRISGVFKGSGFGEFI